MDSILASQHCEPYRVSVLEPVLDEFRTHLDAGTLRLHHVVSTTFAISAFFDYARHSLKELLGPGDYSSEDVATYLDEEFSSDEGGIHIDSLFYLTHAVANACKHTELDSSRRSMKKVIDRYGLIRFNCLREDRGAIMLTTNHYRFDFARVVLRPIVNSVLGLAADPWHETDDPIEQMIALANPICVDCGESEGCRCEEFEYRGESGEFVRAADLPEFDDVMPRISGAYRQQRGE